MINSVESDRIMDYAISNEHDILIGKNYLKEWKISDHYPVEVIVMCENQAEKVKDKTIFDKAKIKDDDKLQESLLNFDYSSLKNDLDLSNNELFSLFFSELNEILVNRKCIKEIYNNNRKKKYKRLEKLIRRKIKKK